MLERDRAGIAVAAAGALGLALVTGEGWLGFSLLAVAVATSALAALGNRSPGFRTDRVYVVVYWVGMILFSRSLLRSLDLGALAQVALLLLGVTAVGGAAFATTVLRRGRSAFLIFLGAYLIVALGVLSASKDTHAYIDVVAFQQEASHALAEGRNPYEIRFPDQYDEADSETFYGPGISEDGVLQFGYPYLPLSLIAVAPFEVIFGDFRIAHALAIVGGAFVMSRIRPGASAESAAVLFLLTSPVLHILIFGWIEPLLVLASALVVLAASRQSKATSYLTGVLMALKQYAVFVVPASLLLLERPFQMREVVRHLVRAGFIVTVTVVPFLLWNPGEFTWSVVELQFLQPFRDDSLSFMAAWAAIAGEPTRVITAVVPLVLVAAASVAALYRTPTGAQGFSLAAGFTFLVAFAFSKQAFANYYVLVMALLFLGAAAGQPQGRFPSTADQIGESHGDAPAPVGAA